MPLRPCNPSTPAFRPVALSVTAQGRGHSHHAGARDPRQALPPKAQGRTRALPGLSPSPGTQAPAPDEEQAPIQKPRGIQTELAYLRQRTRIITHHFPSALGVDDFMQRMEIALYAFGFSGDNSIGGLLGGWGWVSCGCGVRKGMYFWQSHDPSLLRVPPSPSNEQPW